MTKLRERVSVSRRRLLPPDFRSRDLIDDLRAAEKGKGRGGLVSSGRAQLRGQFIGASIVTNGEIL